MSKFDSYKNIIFPDIDSQKALVNALRSKGYNADDFNDAYSKLFFKAGDNELQYILAPFLRALAINHLRNGDTECTRGFREQYELAMRGLDRKEPGDQVSVMAFLLAQSQPRAYATDIEAVALSEVLGVAFFCTQVNRQLMASQQACLYGNQPTLDTPIVHLYNSPGDHFFIHEGNYSSTIGDGNCLYNGFAQMLHQFIQYEEAPNLLILQSQQKMYEQIKDLKPISLADLVVRAKAAPSKKESENIDQQLALEIAQNDLVEKGEPSTPLKVVNPQIEQFYENIGAITFKAKNLRERGYLREAERAESLATKLMNKSNEFFKKTPENQKESFPKFKAECELCLAAENSWVRAFRGWKRLLMDILISLTVIGAIIGVAKWCATGRYSLFPAQKNTAELLEATNESMTLLGSSLT